MEKLFTCKVYLMGRDALKELITCFACRSSKFNSPHCVYPQTPSGVTPQTGSEAEIVPEHHQVSQKIKKIACTKVYFQGQKFTTSIGEQYWEWVL